jgi:hypothetical protein
MGNKILMYALQINKDEFNINSLSELVSLLEKIKEYKYCEIWLDNGEEKFLALLKNADNAFLTFIDNKNGSDFYSVSPDVKDENEELDFYLSNGQQDFYPIKLVIPLEKGIQALKYFYLTGSLEPNIEWSNDPYGY